MKNFKIAFLAVFFFAAIAGVASARDYNLYVDASNDTGVEDGTVDNPFNTINEALTAAELNDEDDRVIYIANGEYREEIELPDGTELYGESKGNTIILGRDEEDDDFDCVVKMNHKTKISDLKIQYGKIGVEVEEDSRAEIKDCKIKDSDEIGVKVLRADRNDKKKFTMKDTEIYDGDGKAVYIRKRKIRLADNEIYDNEEEGIDLRSKVKGTIKDNDIHDNGQSSIEAEVRSMSLKIYDNKLKKSDSSGITFQYRGDNKAGTAIVRDNKIYGNDEYGINCTHPSGGNPPYYYFTNAITLIKNNIYDNELGNLATSCNF